MPEPRRRPTALAFLVIPLALLPVGLAVLLRHQDFSIPVVVSIAFAAPAAGFWFGEMRQMTGPGRAAIGCIGTMVLFVAYIIWAFAIVPRVFGY